MSWKGYEGVINKGIKLLCDTFDKYASEAGITGFQASLIVNGLLAKEMGIQHGRVINWHDLLYPQYEDKFKSIDKKSWEWLVVEAKKMLEKDPESWLKNHLLKIVKGEVPFGYKLSEI